MFDKLYNRGSAYYTVFGIRFSSITLAIAYAEAKADETGNPVALYCYDYINRNGYRMNTYHPETET